MVLCTLYITESKTVKGKKAHLDSLSRCPRSKWPPRTLRYSLVTYDDATDYNERSLTTQKAKREANNDEGVLVVQGCNMGKVTRAKKTQASFSFFNSRFQERLPPFRCPGMPSAFSVSFQNRH
jgi:hypothetical protein